MPRLGPAEWKTNPQTMKGKTAVGVIRDGDWNIALNYLGSNGLKNNPDLTTYDPDAVNWIAAPDEDYIKAVTEVYVPNRCEDRKVVKDGRPTGETTKVCPDGVITWTPGDEQAVHGRFGTSKVISSHEYETFGKIATDNYPNLFKDQPIPSYKEAVETSFIFGAQSVLAAGGVQGASGESVDYAKQAQSGTVLGHKAIYVNFATGSDQPLPTSLLTRSQLKDDLAINSQLAIQIDGYTDNAGSDTVNIALSEKRARR
jgi:hypothetical protein